MPVCVWVFLCALLLGAAGAQGAECPTQTGTIPATQEGLLRREGVAVWRRMAEHAPVFDRLAATAVVDPDGSLEWRATVSGTIEIRLWILSWGDAVEVLAPDSLREVVATAVRNAASEISLVDTTACFLPNQLCTATLKSVTAPAVGRKVLAGLGLEEVVRAGRVFCTSRRWP